MDRIANFKNDLVEAQKRELEFANGIGGTPLLIGDGRVVDLIMPVQPDLNLFVELKADSYKNTENFAFEVYSDNSKKEHKSGAWQAQKNGVHLFAYWFFNQNKYYMFPVEALVAELDKLYKSEACRVVSIPNRGMGGNIYYTECMLVPIKLVEGLALKLANVNAPLKSAV